MTEKLVMLVLPSRERLLDVHEQVNQQPYFKMKQAAVMVKALDGEVRFLDADIHADEGVITGGTLGAIISTLGVAGLGAFLLPGIGAVVALGASALIGGVIGGATGGIVATLIDSGFNDGQVKDLSTQLDKGKAAIIYQYELDEQQSNIDVTNQLRADLAPFDVAVILPYHGE